MRSTQHNYKHTDQTEQECSHHVSVPLFAPVSTKRDPFFGNQSNLFPLELRQFSVKKRIKYVNIHLSNCLQQVFNMREGHWLCCQYWPGRLFWYIRNGTIKVKSADRTEELIEALCATITPVQQSPLRCSKWYSKSSLAFNSFVKKDFMPLSPCGF